jgi:hypothetical protein
MVVLYLHVSIASPTRDICHLTTMRFLPSCVVSVRQCGLGKLLATQAMWKRKDHLGNLVGHWKDKFVRNGGAEHGIC